MKIARQLLSFILPLTAAGIIPCYLVVQFNPFGLSVNLPLPYVQIPLGILFLTIGLVLLVTTIRMFVYVGKGTLAPWDPTRRLVTQGVYGHTRNPMISGVLFILVGEAVLLGSRAIGTWALIFFLINTVYFKLLEEPGLVERFGQEYLAYRKNVPMWVPRLAPWHPEQAENHPYQKSG